MNLAKNDLVVCHRLTKSDKIVVKVLNRKQAEKIMNNKSKLKGMNFSDIVNTSNNIDEEASVNLPQNNHRRNARIYISYSLRHYYQLLYDKVKETMQEDLIHNF